jgi:hypothetical protein
MSQERNKAELDAALMLTGTEVPPLNLFSLASGADFAGLPRSIV